MAALKPLPPAIRALRRNPILVVLVALFGLFQLPQIAYQPTQPVIAAVIGLGMTGVMVLFLPFFQGGLLAMADEGLGGQTGLGTLIEEGKANYVSLLLAYIAILAVNVVFGIIASIAVIIGGIGVIAGSGQPGFAAIGVLAIVAILFGLAYLVFVFLIQFYAHAIVLSDTDLVTAFKRSFELVRNNILSVLGYSAIVFVGSILFGGIAGVASMLLSPQPTGIPVPDFSVPVLVAAAIVYVLIISILGAFYATYSVAFYREIDTTAKPL